MGRSRSGGASALGDPRRCAEYPAWDLRPSPWNYGPLVIHVDRVGGGEVTCYVPPGTSAHGETGLGVARWRCARWLAEPEFVEAREPVWVEEIGIDAVQAHVPEDFHRWAGHITAAHAARLRAFARHRPGAMAAWSAVHELETALETCWPGTIKRHGEDLTAAAAAAIRTLAPAVTMRTTDVLRLAAMRGRDWAYVALQAALIGGLYAAYRQIRPDDFDFAGLGWAGGTSQPFQELAGLLFRAYDLLHIPITAAFLVWVYFRHHSAFGFVRNVMLLVPGLVMAPYTIDLLFGKFGAHYPPPVPIVHVGIALAIGVAGFLLASGSVMRILFAAYPALVTCLAFASVPGTAAPARLVLAVLGALALTALAWYVARLAGSSLADRSVASGWHQPGQLDIRQRLAHMADAQATPRP